MNWGQSRTWYFVIVQKTIFTNAQDHLRSLQEQIMKDGRGVPEEQKDFVSILGGAGSWQHEFQHSILIFHECGTCCRWTIIWLHQGHFHAAHWQNTALAANEKPPRRAEPTLAWSRATKMQQISLFWTNITIRWRTWQASIPYKAHSISCGTSTV